MSHVRTLLTFAASGVMACTGGSAAPAHMAAEGSVLVQHPGGLSQRVTLVPAVVIDGRDVEVRSVLVNETDASLELSARICGLDYAGSLELSHPPEVLKCAAYSATMTLAAGDSTVTTDLMRVASDPGTYELRVRHAVAPEQWASMQVVVRWP